MISGISRLRGRLSIAVLCSALLFTAHSSWADGSNPASSLTNKAGILYGTTQFGGANGKGTIYQVTPAGALKILYSFTGVSDGAAPRGGLLLNTDGDFYGTTSAGGASSAGTIYKVTQSGTLTTLYAFSATTGKFPALTNSDGAFPYGNLITGSDGALYGAAYLGGAHATGTIFRVTTAGAFSTFYTFSALDSSGHNTDGAAPQTGLLRSGLFFCGVTSAGGAKGYGTVFKLSSTGSFTKLYAFTNGVDGASPVAALVGGPSGQFYGSTAAGGASGKGTLFHIGLNGGMKPIHSFSGGDGANPTAPLLYARDKNFYGVTMNGGANGKGTLFKLTVAGVLTTLHSYGAAAGDGATPEAGLIQLGAGLLYGTTFYGGLYAEGAIYQSDTVGNVATIYSFLGNLDGRSPTAPLLLASNGNYYGTAYSGGPSGQGTVFQLTPAGAFTALYDFTAVNSSESNSDGARPYAGLVQGSDSSLYGTTQYGGTDGYGTIFKITTAGVLTTLYSFTGPDGARPVAGLVSDGASTLYGVTHDGGPNDKGVLFKITLTGVFTSLYAFSATTGGKNSDGSHPAAPLLLASDGNLYGTTLLGGTLAGGTVFKVTTAGTFTSLHSLTGISIEGSNPEGALIQDSTPSDGILYGTTSGGGSNSSGTVFKVTTAGHLNTLYSFGAYSSDASNPASGLVLGADGRLYGTTQSGGFYGYGTFYRIDTFGDPVIEYSFSGSLTDGADPVSAVIIGSDGSFYGTTTSGGQYNNGTIYKVTATGTLTLLHSFQQ